MTLSIIFWVLEGACSGSVDGFVVMMVVEGDVGSCFGGMGMADLGAPLAVGWDVIELKDLTGAAGFASMVVEGGSCTAAATSTLSCSPARKEKGFFLVSVIVAWGAGVACVPIDPNERVWFDGEAEASAGVPMDPNERV